ncbi:hypothetical protein GJA_2386 [Janthinobacterium agaricidamnosum NBRC 102515 = DSM 9628]|uniref:HEXXH motif domain protein n=2 Tax=Janthinobacterium agaricidamnosum TaxID=55508 RepID=W0V2H4_9BURK|nr:hypothetical protein GJA_2386 [Janthinobacterium agaricidamnosum NBRC 102515 = DSM 9628]
MQFPAPELLDTLELALSSHAAFGNSDYIRQRQATCYRRRLHTLSPAMPVAGQLLNALNGATQQVQLGNIGDTVLRCAIQHAQRQTTTGEAYGLPLEHCAAVLQQAVHNVEAGRDEGVLLTGLQPRLRLHDSHLWHEEHADDVAGRAFRYLMQDNYGSPLCTPTPQEIAMLQRGWQLLQQLLPLASRSALRHVQLIALFPKIGAWVEKASSSQYRLNGTLFLSRDLIGNPWWVAEHLLHESLHQKLYDFRHGHTLLTPGYQRDDAARICSLWNAPDASQSNHWDAHRAIAAFHVYVHLALLCSVAEQREAELAPAYGPIDNMMSGSRRAIDRSRYLGRQIQTVGWNEYGEAGRRMVNWLMAVLDELDTAPRPDGAYAHLLLDLYQRQTRQVEKFIAGGDRALASQLQERMQQEVTGAEMALSTAAATQERKRFRQVLDQLLSNDVATSYPAVRKLISKTLLEVSATQDLRATENATGEMIKKMVQQSSMQLSAMGVLV